MRIPFGVSNQTACCVASTIFLDNSGVPDTECGDGRKGLEDIVRNTAVRVSVVWIRSRRFPWGSKARQWTSDSAEKAEMSDRTLVSLLWVL